MMMMMMMMMMMVIMMIRRCPGRRVVVAAGRVAERVTARRGAPLPGTRPDSPACPGTRLAACLGEQLAVPRKAWGLGALG